MNITSRRVRSVGPLINPMRSLAALAVGGALSVGGAVVAAAATGVVVARRTRHRWETATDPCGPAGLEMPDGEATTVTTDDGAELAVTVAGDDGAPTVVLVHGWTCNRAVWAAVARRLVSTGHRVVAYDQRGHGESTLGSAPLTVEQLGSDLGAVLEKLDVTDAVLVGHSMGGMAVQSMAIDHPGVVVDRARALVLVSTAARLLGYAVPASVVELLLGDWLVHRIARGSIGLVIARSAVGRGPRLAHIELTRDCLVATTAPARAGFLVGMSAMDLRAGLGSIALPTTVLVGTHDLLTPPRLGRALAAAIPGADLVVLPGAGHMLPVEDPDRILDVICAAALRP